MNMLTTNETPAAGRKVRGFTLIEVLIALIIMSVGMLGIAGMYVRSMQAGRTSTLHHHAITLAGDIADRIRANPRAGAAYEGAGLDFNCVNGGVDCSPAEMAANDILLWEQQATATLPTGTVNIVFNNAVVPATYQITVAWEEPGEQLDYSITIPVFGI
jgi:type IV pilus assembly protein PilV